MRCRIAEPDTNDGFMRGFPGPQTSGPSRCWHADTIPRTARSAAGRRRRGRTVAGRHRAGFGIGPSRGRNRLPFGSTGVGRVERLGLTISHRSDGPARVRIARPAEFANFRPPDNPIPISRRRAPLNPESRSERCRFP